MKLQIKRLKKLNRDGILIICCGTNDQVIKKSTLAFHNISHMVTKNNHISNILVNIPYRYDTTNTNTVNEGIEKFNKRLDKLIKASPNASVLKTNQKRKMFTKHGLRHNRFWKQLLFHQKASVVYSLFEHKTTYSKSLCWNKPNDSTSQDKSLNGVTTSNRKLPVTRFKNLLIVNNRGFNNACRTMNYNVHKDLDQFNKNGIE